MKKVTWLLGLSLLLGGGSVFGQTEQSYSVRSFSDLKTMLTDLAGRAQKVTSLANLEQSIQDKLQEKPGEPTVSKYETTIDPAETSSYEAIYKYIDTGTGVDQSFFYGVTSGARITVYIALTKELGLLYNNSLDWIETSSHIVADAEDGIEIQKLRKIGVVYMKDKEVSVATCPVNVGTLVDAIFDGMESAVNGMQSWRTMKEETLYPEGYETWKTSYDELLTNRTTLKGEITALNKYQNVDITTDIEGNESLPLTNWPAGYTINGNGFVIKGAGAADAALFATNEGEINKLIVSTGRIAKDNNGKIENSIGRLSSGGYRVYDEDGKATEKSSLVDAAYALRTIYGYDFATGDISKINEEGSNKVYQAKYADVDHKNLHEFKTNILPSGSLKYDATDFNYRTTENAITYIEDADAIDAKGYKALENVAVKKSTGYICENTVMVEGVIEGRKTNTFYIPEDFVSKKLTYGRDFNKNNATICLPFTLTETLKEQLDIQYLHQFLEVRDEGFAFSWEREVPANKPCLIQFKSEAKKGQIFNITTDLNFVATPSELRANELYGTYTRQTIGELISSHKGEKVYTTQDDKLVLLTEEVKDFPFDQFRAYVAIPASEVDAPSYRMILLDEDGNEMDTTTDVKSVATDKDNFNVAGGNNAIEISTEKACDVKVYTVNGTLVKSAHVEAGNTSLPVKAGVYVVNGTKVIVK